LLPHHFLILIQAGCVGDICFRLRRALFVGGVQQLLQEQHSAKVAASTAQTCLVSAHIRTSKVITKWLWGHQVRCSAGVVLLVGRCRAPALYCSPVPFITHRIYRRDCRRDCVIIDHTIPSTVVVGNNCHPSHNCCRQVWVCH